MPVQCLNRCRSVALADFEGQAYLLCGMGDGQLHNWRLDPAAQSLNGACGWRRAARRFVYDDVHGWEWCVYGLAWHAEEPLH
jgi:hypothetical protein